jgi:hypothetical protein
MHLYQRRPKPQSRPLQAEFAQGKCYLARQSALVFGRNRREPVEWRVAVSWALNGPRVYVLPSTTKHHPDFFFLPRDRCFLKRRHEDARDTYLCPQVEALSLSDVIELGILDRPTRLDIADWKRAQEISS